MQFLRSHYDRLWPAVDCSRSLAMILEVD